MPEQMNLLTQTQLETIEYNLNRLIHRSVDIMDVITFNEGETMLRLDKGDYRVHFTTEYRDPLRQQIIRFKYNGRWQLGCPFGELIYKNLPEDYDLSDYDYLLPIPSKPSSFTERGYNPVHLIGKRVSKLSGLPLATGILEALERPSQMGLSGSERRENIVGAFPLIDPFRVEGKSLLVLDDVFTTGSTMDEVIRTLSTADPRQLDALVLSKVPCYINSN